MASRLTLAAVAEHIKAEGAVRRGNDDDLLAIIRLRAAEADKAVNKERTHRLRMADEQRAYVDRQITTVRDNAAREHDTLAFRVGAIEQRAIAAAGRGFFGRFKWLLTGK